MVEYRASFDGDVTFLNGGGLQVRGFRIDLPSDDVDESEIARLFVRSLGLLMTDRVTLRNVTIVEEAHKGTRGGPSDTPSGATGPGSTAGRLVELNHVIREAMVTYPGLAGPTIEPVLTREASRERYGPDTEFEIGRITMVGNTGTYLDSPFHRYADGGDLSTITLEQTVDLPAVVVRLEGAGSRGIDAAALGAFEVAGRAVLLHTGDAARFGTPAYGEDPHFLTRAGAELLVDRGAVLVGIDAINIDDTADGLRPAHTVLLAANIPIVEHLTGLDQLPATGARFTAVPLRIAELTTVAVRAFARLPG